MIKMNKFLDIIKPNVRPIIASLSFISMGYLLIENKDIGIEAGELYSDDSNIEVGAAISMKDWIFALTKDVNDSNWYISGFHNTFQFQLEHVQSNSNNLLIQFVVEKITPILYPELFTVYLDQHRETKEDMKLKWSLQQHH